MTAHDRSSLPPTYTATLFRPLLGELLELLRGLSGQDWERATVAGQWRVRDVAGHLLDNDLRRLAADRDGSERRRAAPPMAYAELVAVIDDVNRGGVSWARRLSPRLLVELVAITGEWLAEFVESVDPHGPALWAVAWAGEATSANWMDIGREYTERWHHQMQIRDAVGAPLLLEDRWLHPLLELSVRALPRAYEGVHASVGASVVFSVGDAPAMRWSLTCEGEAWALAQGAVTDPAVSVRADPDDAWRLFYNALPAPGLARLRVEGDVALARPLFAARSVMV